MLSLDWKLSFCINLLSFCISISDWSPPIFCFWI